MRETNAAMRHLEEAVTGAGGIALRYGGFYGADNDGLVEPVRKRRFPIVG
jgi:2-alkyl-3-oxoalkanoate reductase